MPILQLLDVSFSHGSFPHPFPTLWLAWILLWDNYSIIRCHSFNSHSTKSCLLPTKFLFPLQSLLIDIKKLLVQLLKSQTLASPTFLHSEETQKMLVLTISELGDTPEVLGALRSCWCQVLLQMVMRRGWLLRKSRSQRPEVWGQGSSL